MAAAMQEGFLPLDRHRGRHEFGPSEILVSSSREHDDLERAQDRSFCGHMEVKRYSIANFNYEFARFTYLFIYKFVGLIHIDA